MTKKDDFEPLASAMKSVDANASSQTPIFMSAYTPTNTARACPAVVGTAWLASDILPPTPNTTLCENMVAASACVPADGLSADDTAALFGTVCGLAPAACAGISANATTGTYGNFVMCTASQQLANALNSYYTAQKKAASACDFGGKAKVVSPTESLLPVPVKSSSGGSGGSASGSSGGSSVSNPSTNSTTGTGGSGKGAVAGSSSVAPPSTTTLPPGGSASGSASSGSSSSDPGAAVALNNGTSADNSPSPQSSSGSSSGGTSGAMSVVGPAGWAGSLLFAVGAGAALLL